MTWLATSSSPLSTSRPAPSYYVGGSLAQNGGGSISALFTYEPLSGGIDDAATTAAAAAAANWSETSPAFGEYNDNLPCVNLYGPEARTTLPAVHYLYLYAGSAIVAMGCLGHAVTAAALLLSRPLRRQSLAPYLLVLSAAGVLALLAGLAPHVVWHGTCGVVNLGEQHPDSGFFCSLLMAARYYALHLYSWTEVLIAAERMVAIRWPLQCKRWLTRRAGACIVTAAALVLLPVEAVVFVSYGYNQYDFCTVIDESLYSAWPLTHLAFYCMAPVAVMLPSNALTLSAMRRSTFESASLRRAKPVTVMMMALNCLFVITATPFVVAEFLRDEPEAFAVAFSMIDVCRLLLYAGSASTIFIYVIMAARFRKTLANFATRSFDRLCSVLSLPPIRVEAPTDCGGGRERTGRTLRSFSCPDTVITSARMRTPSPLGERHARTKVSVG